MPVSFHPAAIPAPPPCAHLLLVQRHLLPHGALGVAQQHHVLVVLLAVVVGVVTVQRVGIAAAVVGGWAGKEERALKRYVPAGGRSRRAPWSYLLSALGSRHIRALDGITGWLAVVQPRWVDKWQAPRCKSPEEEKLAIWCEGTGTACQLSQISTRPQPAT